MSNDNPFSDTQFKALKYRPDFPERFGSVEDARAFCRPFFGWYNAAHHHSTLGLLTPEVVHYRRTAQVLSAREGIRVLELARHAHILLQRQEPQEKRRLLNFMVPRRPPRSCAADERVVLERSDLRSARPRPEHGGTRPGPREGMAR